MTRIIRAIFGKQRLPDCLAHMPPIKYPRYLALHMAAAGSKGALD